MTSSTASLDVQPEKSLFERARVLHEKKNALLISHNFSKVQAASSPSARRRSSKRRAHAKSMTLDSLYVKPFSIQGNVFLEEGSVMRKM
ncbi:hypothetical protein AB0L06_18045 [Spirillospora sp. NPDC052269]